MVADLVGAEILVDLGEELFDGGLSARPGGAGFGVDHDRRWIDEVAADERQDAEQRARRIASRIGDDTRLAQFTAMELTEAVYRFLEQVGRRMVCAVGRAV